MDAREMKALEIAAKCRIVFDGCAYLVPSQSGSGRYRVTLAPEASCACEDFQLRKQPCKHILAVRLVRERDGQDGVVTVAEPPTPAPQPEKPKRPTYKQNWPAYNMAQRQEKNRFQVLLAELCKGLQEPPAKPTGRPRTPMADVVFACAFKVYSTLSSRRFNCDLEDAHGKGYLTRPMHPNKVNTHLESETLTVALKALVERSSLPMTALETSFAPDSSGFSTSRFVRWYDEKYGGERSGREWVKAHIMCGVNTHVVTAVEILDKDAADCPQFKALAETTARSFTVKEVSADKAYLSHDNLEQVEALGGTLYVPFKSNSVDGEAGSVWSKMFHYFQFRRDEFLPSYHKRSNVETAFSMVKAKFRDSVRSKTDTAMRNEVLAKFLCHNICCVIMAQCELGIEAVFWKDEPAPEEEPGVLPFSGRGVV